MQKNNQNLMKKSISLKKKPMKPLFIDIFNNTGMNRNYCKTLLVKENEEMRSRQLQEKQLKIQVLDDSEDSECEDYVRPTIDTLTAICTN